MSSKSNSSSSSSSGSGNGNGSSGYSITSSDTNDQVNPLSTQEAQQAPLAVNQPIVLTHPQGNHYCSRDYGSEAANSNSYHYSNT